VPKTYQLAGTNYVFSHSTIDYVVSYDVPTFLTTYIHRVGRTARAGRSGTAITIVDKVRIWEGIRNSKVLAQPV
jgi:superfamily II DNA/RNA helicase